ncbi:MAG: gamma-glutamyltransferase [Candidatus Sumerlaeia bacterium]|nr:gamma-glutamyltransferase [Candidatus Sumerlaeia bacterium]
MMSSLVQRAGSLLAMAAIVLTTSACATSASAQATSPQVAAGAVAAAHPEAVRAGVATLAAGGNALDAAVATAFALNVAEPYASGIGGGGFLVYYDAATGQTHVLDYREVAPSALSDEHVMRNGRVDGPSFRSGGKGVAAPGMARGLLLAHERHGRLPRASLLAPAIRLAEQGFEITPALAETINENFDRLGDDPASAEIFLEGGLFPPDAGQTLVQPQLAATLRAIAENGETAIYGPEPAARIAQAVQDAGGPLSADDVAAFRPRDRAPIRGTYRGHEILTIPPPSSGGLQVLMALSILDGYDVAALGPRSPRFLALLVKALEEAQSATEELVADPAFRQVPVEQLLSAEWAAQARARIDAALVTAGLGGDEAADNAYAFVPARKEPIGNTTHLSVIDRQGNMVALTQTINYFFGAGITVPGMGIVLNNEMYDFTFTQGNANFPEAGKIPRSSMAPTLVIRDGQPVATLGTPGGKRIPSALVQILIHRIDFGATLQEALDAPRLHVEAARAEIAFEARLGEETMAQVGSQLAGDGRAWKLQPRGDYDRFFGGAQGIWLDPAADGTWNIEGAADPRRDGVSMTERDLAP